MAASIVLCVDPDPEARAETCVALREGTELAVVGCDSLAAARESLVPSVGCVVTEYELPDGTGMELAAYVREAEPDTDCVLLSSVDADSVDSRGADAPVSAHVEKGPNGDRTALVSLVNETVAHHGETEYPIPPDEAERLEAVSRYVEEPPELEHSLDRLTTLAAGSFDVPMAAVSLMEEREQRFLSCFGADVPNVERDGSVCTHAMLESGVTVIPDLQADPRFADDSGLEAAGIRAYASANITTSDGHVIGTFCLYDDEPREFDEAARRQLSLFAEETMDQFELRRLLVQRATDDAAD